ncbi:hypothetical protein PQX77_010348 [Marasmius sp. AFHP31]|nr:hypothetical protein PQX77_010348 [Marasmius sp. AFHP31]
MLSKSLTQEDRVNIGTYPIKDVDNCSEKITNLPTSRGPSTDNKNGPPNSVENTPKVDSHNLHADPEKPSLARSWEAVMREVDKHDEGLLGGWKEDIDTLLVFAGLFSAVVTAFTIESYQWLSENPEDTTVALLRQISEQLSLGNSTSPPPSHFEATASSVRINALWFLSLIIALVDALFGLLCKQWLREHRRPAYTRTPGEALALRWLRHESLDKWHVHTILAFLPILLELALFLFLAGVLELLWALHPIPFVIALTVIGSAGLFYLGATIIPSIYILRKTLELSRDVRLATMGMWFKCSSVDFIMTLPATRSICPYKSPQAWAVFKGIKALSSLLELLWNRLSLNREWLHEYYVQNIWALTWTMRNLSSWSSVDLEAIQRTVTATSPPFHELDALRWLVKEFRDTPTMIPHLQEILETYPPHLVIPAVLNQWFFHPSREWTKEDIGAALRHPAPFDSLEEFSPVRLYERKLYLGKELFDRLLHWNHIAANISFIPAEDHAILPKFLGQFCSQIKAKHWTGFPVSFRIMDGLFEDNHSRELGLSLWRTCEDTQMKWSSDRQNPFDPLVDDLARYILTSTKVDRSTNITSTASPFLITPDGLRFMKHMHAYGLQASFFLTHGEGTERWVKATKIIQQLHHLPEDTFEVPYGRFEAVVLAFERTLDDPSSARKFDREFPYFDFFKEHWRGVGTYTGKTTFVHIMSKAWEDALEHVKEVLDLPRDYFAPILRDGGDPPSDGAQPPNFGDSSGEVRIRKKPGTGEMPAEATSDHTGGQGGHEKRDVKVIGGPDAAENV